MIEERIQHIIATALGIDEATITENTSIENVEKWDSLQHLNLVIALEEEFKIKFDDREMPELTSFSAIRESLIKKLQ